MAEILTATGTLVTNAIGIVTGNQLLAVIAFGSALVGVGVSIFSRVKSA